MMSLRLGARFPRLAAAVGVSLALLGLAPAASANGIGSAYVANTGAKQLTIVDVEGSAAVDVIPTKGQPAGLTVSGDGTMIYVAEKDTNMLEMISRNDYSSQGTVPVGTAPVAVTLSHDGRLAFVVNSGS